MPWTAYMPNGEEIVVTEDQLDRFARMYVQDPDLLSRISRLFWFEAYVLDKAFGVGTHEIVAAVCNLEEGEPPNGVKPASQFNRPPLRGLWHKHYFSAHFLPMNIGLAHGRNGVRETIEDVFGPHMGQPATEEMLEEMARRLVEEAVERRADDGKLTGEWVVYAKRDGRNLYLCLNTHAAPDQVIYDNIVQQASRDFPDVEDWIREASDAMPAQGRRGTPSMTETHQVQVETHPDAVSTTDNTFKHMFEGTKDEAMAKARQTYPGSRITYVGEVRESGRVG